MALMTRLMTGLDVEPLLKQLAAQPHLWFERPDRLLGNSPHSSAGPSRRRYASRRGHRRCADNAHPAGETSLRASRSRNVAR